MLWAPPQGLGRISARHVLMHVEVRRQLVDVYKGPLARQLGRRQWQGAVRPLRGRLADAKAVQALACGGGGKKGSEREREQKSGEKERCGLAGTGQRRKGAVRAG